MEAICEYAHEKILIVGNPGAGKSTLLARVMSDAAQQALFNPKVPVPVLVELKLYGKSGIWELIQAALENHNLIQTLNAPNSALNFGGTIHGDQIGSQSHRTEP